MALGDRYLLFIATQKGVNFVDNCGNSGDLQEKRLQVQEILELTRESAAKSKE